LFFWLLTISEASYFHEITSIHYVDSDDKTITFITKIKGGVTSAIHRRVHEQPSQTATMPIMVGGSHGEHASTHKFDAVL
jgi:hypothetical protein